MSNLQDKVALVTGAGKGIGAAIARKLASQGATVYVHYRSSKDAAIALATEIGGHAVQADLSTSQGVDALLEQIDVPLDILVNNAGVSWGAPLDEFPELGWDKVMDTNVKGVFFLTQKLLPFLEKNGSPENRARVINVGSVDGIKSPAFETFSYGPSKAAVHHLTRNLARHLIKRDIIVNAIAPGPFPTWMLSTGVGGGGDTEIDWSAVAKSNPSGRVGTAEDIAGLAIFLSSRAGSYTVGEVITCDGGSVASA